MEWAGIIGSGKEAKFIKYFQNTYHGKYLVPAGNLGYKLNWGVPFYELKKMAEEYGKDYDLAIELWCTNREQ